MLKERKKISLSINGIYGINLEIFVKMKKE
jgi:hypothetical protein